MRTREASIGDFVPTKTGPRGSDGDVGTESGGTVTTEGDEEDRGVGGETSAAILAGPQAASGSKATVPTTSRILGFIIPMPTW